MPLPPPILHNARALRATQTDAENLLWMLLRGRRFGGYKFRRQHPVGRYILDFYCHDALLAIELDGGGHGEEQQAEYDGIRTAELEGAGIHVLRYWNHEVLLQNENVLEAIWNCLAGKSSPPHPP